MKHLPFFLLVFCSILSLTACNETKPIKEVKTVDWYKQPENKTALNAKIAECKNNPGQLKNTPDCVNAYQAKEDMLSGGSFGKVREPAIPTFGKPRTLQ